MIPVTKYKRMRSVCGSIGKNEGEQKCIQGYVGETGRKRPLDRHNIAGRIMLKSTSNSSAGKAGIGLIWIRKGQRKGCCRGGNEHSHNVIGGHLLD